MIRAAQGRAARKRYLEVAPVLDEQSRRRFVALEAHALGLQIKKPRGKPRAFAKVSGSYHVCELYQSSTSFLAWSLA